MRENCLVCVFIHHVYIHNYNIYFICFLLAYCIRPISTFFQSILIVSLEFANFVYCSLLSRGFFSLSFIHNVPFSFLRLSTDDGMFCVYWCFFFRFKFRTWLGSLSWNCCAVFFFPLFFQLIFSSAFWSPFCVFVVLVRLKFGCYLSTNK